ncbi:MAG: hypothetical protein LBU70_02110 [Chitinispirillales bacterium]|nr:hypothetical protein [Chitinispirillales bacterium]
MNGEGDVHSSEVGVFGEKTFPFFAPPTFHIFEILFALYCYNKFLPNTTNTHILYLNIRIKRQNNPKYLKGGWKMRKLMVLAAFVAGMAAGGGYAQEMPVEIRRFLENYPRDTTNWGPLTFKERGSIPDSVQMGDLRFRVLQVHRFKRNISLGDYPDTVALSEVIEPSGFWRILITAHNKPFYELRLDNRTGEPRITEGSFSAGSDPRCNLWRPLLEIYPESAGINPVLVTVACEISPRGSHRFLYFKQLGPRKIYYSSMRGVSNTLDSLFSASIETLDDSRILMEYLKKRGGAYIDWANRGNRSNNTNASMKPIPLESIIVMPEEITGCPLSP